MEKRHYGAMDGLLMIVTFGTAMIHICTNGNYEITGYVYNFVCANYFEVGRTNILYSACFFLASVLIYLSHMVIFRIVEKMKSNQILGNGWL
jgi:hypothetical protein